MFMSLRRDALLLFGARIIRMFAYGFLSVILALYLDALGYGKVEIGLLLSLTLVGDTLISLWMTTSADRLGRRRMLFCGAVLMLFAGALFVSTRHFWLLLIAATIGVISPSGNEVGPFLSIEQAALAQTIPGERRTHYFAWYNLVGSFATAAGSLISGGLAHLLRGQGLPELEAYRAIVLGYAALGLVLASMFTRLSRAVEVEVAAAATPADGGQPLRPSRLGLHRSRGMVFRLAALFSLDAFAGGFVMQAIVAYWFHLRFGIEPARLGAIFFGANILAGISALAAARLAARFGLIRTMVFTHIPSNILLILVPLMPSATLAVAVLLMRFSISQMDVPTRQSYTMAVVSPDERSAAAGITGVARSVGASLAPLLAGPMLASTLFFSTPFFLAGFLKLIYDGLLYRGFHKAEE